jgi:hypothetical protein
MTPNPAPATPATPAAVQGQAPVAGTPAPGTPAPQAGAAPVTPDPALTGVVPDPKAAAPAATVVPDKYDIKLPDGSLLDAGAVEKASSFAKDLGLSNENAQKLLDRESAAILGYQQAQATQLKNQNDTTWKNELIADKEFGGQAFDENGEIAYNAASKWFGDEFCTAIKQMGINHHPLLFKGLVRLGKASANDKLVIPGAQGDGQERIQDVFYPSMKKEK